MTDEASQLVALERDLYTVLARYDNTVQYLGLQAMAARYAVLLGQTKEQSQNLHLRMRALAEQDPKMLALLGELRPSSDPLH